MQIAHSAWSQLVIVDMQIKLSTVMPADAMQEVTKCCGILAQAAVMLDVPVLVTEQYPQGIGETIHALTQYLPKVKPISKMAFSAYAEPRFNQQLHRDRPQIILAGMEAHICVLQTALDLANQGKKVFVVEDAIVSRDNRNKINAINRLYQAGCIITNTESVMFEWLESANHNAFKAVSKLIR